MKNVKTAVKSGGELLGSVTVTTYEDKQELRANATDRDVKDLNRQRVTICSICTQFLLIFIR